VQPEGFFSGKDRERGLKTLPLAIFDTAISHGFL
jgi:hypothetical protein